MLELGSLMLIARWKAASGPFFPHMWPHEGFRRLMRVHHSNHVGVLGAVSRPERLFPMLCQTCELGKSAWYWVSWVKLSGDHSLDAEMLRTGLAIFFGCLRAQICSPAAVDTESLGLLKHSLGASEVKLSTVCSCYFERPTDVRWEGML